MLRHLVIEPMLLTQFFKLQEQLAAHIREEEEKSKNVYDPDANLMEAALKDRKSVV